MDKSILVFYVPAPFGDTDAVKKQRNSLSRNLHQLNTGPLGTQFHVLIVEDPDRSKIETEVFFNKEKI